MTFLDFKPLGAAWLVGLSLCGCTPGEAAQAAAEAPASAEPALTANAAPAQPAQTPAAQPLRPLQPAQPAQPTQPAQPAPGAHSPLCDTLCAHTLTLHCGTIERCQEACAAMAATDQCKPQLGALLDCLVAQPAANFECDAETGAPAVRDGHCETEQDTAASCLEALPPPSQ